MEETIEYEDKIKMIYRDGKGHNYTRTKYLQSEPKIEVPEAKGDQCTGILNLLILLFSIKRVESIYNA